MNVVVRRTTLPGTLALALAFSAGRPAPAAAQAELLGPGAGFISAGVAGIETDDLEAWLGERGYPTFGRSAGSIGIGAYRVLDNGLVLGFEFNGLGIGAEEHEGAEIGVGGGYATLGIGYAIQVSPRVRVVPRLGLGAGGMAIWVDRQDTVAFEQVLAQEVAVTDRMNSMGRDGLVADLGIGAEFLPRDRSGLLIGVRAGYLAGPASSEWESPDFEVAGGPDASIAGPYARITLGWAWRK